MSHQLKFLIISRRINSQQSAPKCNLNLATALAKIGCETHVLTSYVNDKELKMLKTCGIVTHIVKPFYASKYAAPIFYTFMAKRLKEKHGINIVLGNGYTLCDDITWVHFPKLAWIKKAQELHLDVPYKSRVEAWFEKQIFKSSKFLLAPSKLVVNDLINLYGMRHKKIIHVYHGVNVNYYKPLPQTQREEYRRKMGMEDKLVLLFVGEPIKKGLYILLSELRRFSNLKDIDLLIAGLKPSQELFSHVVRSGFCNNVKILGFLNPEGLRLYYQTVDAIILPSLYDAFSLVTLEAMACGAIPVVSKYAGVAAVSYTHLTLPTKA